MQQTPISILEHVFGYDKFRGQQEAIVNAVVGGDDALVIMPTGGGKSLCYQIPALLRPGVAIVVSPLIALMQDQVEALRALGVKAGFLNSTLTPQEIYDNEQSIQAGQLDVVYIAPERLIQARTINLLQHSQIALFAIDEAHCVAQWGHDFRADYLRLDVLHNEFPAVPRIALTATADTRTRQEIIDRLALHNAQQFIAGFDRPNIQYRIQPKDRPRQQLIKFLKQEHDGDAGIIYCLSRDKVEKTAAWLREEGFDALPYHAGLPPEIRAKHQRRFLREDSVVMVATIAFGMGIDKPDVRFVAHLDMPKSIEAYYQETGRAGRDGAPSTALLLYGFEDVVKLRQMTSNSEGNEAFRRAEQERLNAMLALCELASCRRQTLLRYFDDELPKPCGNCDTCIEPPQTWDATEAAQKALSCVYRTGQRFGVQHVVDVLRGEKNDRIKQYGHDQLTTFGIGSDISQHEWKGLFRQLAALGYLDVDREFGSLLLTESCRTLLRGDQSIQLRKDAKITTKKGKRQAIEVDHDDLPLWHALRQCRRRLSEEYGVPPYVIFHDATLKHMLEVRPQNTQQLMQVSGVGDAKAQKYGQEFLDVIRNYEYSSGQ
ncbi:DNA helicase RecQ [Marinagarivorans cellulosilyticus]|uniref:DNA helicase RecQ n=1 Tax=Marinagarivorans cellulosilyticus TaxID=2721545 RepID=A0AAN1WGD1_9GAMM|nr:DNA helicase RecQ [Marinagarivorans cellulosilyticus]BCD97104.1 ATP-dependent DNA helicase RecQ [Marinagarivorans cellulosilyticus]